MSKLYAAGAGGESGGEDEEMPRETLRSAKKPSTASRGGGDDAAGPRSVEKPLLAALAETKGVRRLFDREADNHHAEGLLLAQLAARAIAEVPGTITETFAASSLRGAARAVAAAARALARDAEGGQVATRPENEDDAGAPSDAFPGWAGGATNHGSAFAVVNRACCMSQVLPPLFEAFKNPDADVRKAVVFCLVDMYMVLGEQLTPHLAVLSTSQLKLVTIYINRTAKARAERSSAAEAEEKLSVEKHK